MGFVHSVALYLHKREYYISLLRSILIRQGRKRANATPMQLERLKRLADGGAQEKTTAAGASGASSRSQRLSFKRLVSFSRFSCMTLENKAYKFLKLLKSCTATSVSASPLGT